MNKLRLLAPIILAVLASCGTKDGAENTQVESISFSYQIDTVYIDAKDEFLFLNMGLYISDYDPKTDLLYNLNPQTSRMEVIDMKKGELLEIIQYDQDGPNSVKEMFTSGTKITDSGEKWFTDYRSIIHLNAAGEKVGQFRLSNASFSGDTLPDKMEIDGMGKINRSGKYFVSHYGDYLLDGEGLQGLAILDLEQLSKRLIKLDVFQSLEKYELSSPDGERAGARAGERSFITLTETEILHSNSAHNRLLSLNLESGEYREIKLASEFLPDEKPGLYPKKANSLEQFDEFHTLKKQEVTFGPWSHDDERGYFWRISRERNGGSAADPIFSFFITVLDSGLNQIAETELDEGDALPFEGLPSLSFFRKGDLYMFLNLEDELAFVRLKPNFKDE
ncbi:DUF4221 family protein [Algoriphagus winogradskyi]|nr:DUF4221 family protein [Algoriphagus winogradskyi]